MLKKETAQMVAEISRELKLPMDEVQSVLQSYEKHLKNRADSFVHNTNIDSLLFGISSLDAVIKMRPGTTLVHAHNDIGKTSVAKTVAVAAKRQGLNVMFYDVENKLSLHDSARLLGIGHASSSRSSGLQNIIRQGIVDMLIVDTITGIPDMSQDLFMTKVRPFVPYILLTSQRRHPYFEAKSVPAVKPEILTSANTIISLESKETITVEGEDFLRVQFKVEKYETDRNMNGSRSSFIIRNNFVDNLYTAYDYLRSSGEITSIGRRKTLSCGSSEISFESMKKAAGDPELVKKIMDVYHESAGIICKDRDIYAE
jgi:hypothetical protein